MKSFLAQILVDTRTKYEILFLFVFCQIFQSLASIFTSRIWAGWLKLITRNFAEFIWVINSRRDKLLISWNIFLMRCHESTACLHQLPIVINAIFKFFTWLYSWFCVLVRSFKKKCSRRQLNVTLYWEREYRNLMCCLLILWQ